MTGYEAGSWYGVIVPKGTPSNIVAVLNAASEALQIPVTPERMQAQGLEPEGSSPAEFDEKIRRDIVKWRRVFKEAHIVMQ